MDSTRTLDLFSYALREALKRKDHARYELLKLQIAHSELPEELKFIKNMRHLIKTDTIWEYEDTYIRRKIDEFSRFVDSYDITEYDDIVSLAKLIIKQGTSVEDILIYIILCPTHFENITECPGLEFVNRPPTQEDLEIATIKFEQLDILAKMFTSLIENSEYDKYLPCITDGIIVPDELGLYIEEVSKCFIGHIIHDGTWHFKNTMATKLIKAAFIYISQFARRKNFGVNVGFLTTILGLMNLGLHHKDMLMIIIIVYHYKLVYLLVSLPYVH